MPGHSVYAGTKGAIVADTRELASELEPRGVTVNAFAPGGVCGGWTAGRGKGAVLLATAAGRYILGQTLVVDGGTTAWLPFGDGFRKPIAENLGKGYVPGL